MTKEIVVIKQRIQTLDGLRFLAAIGVLWVHTWTAFGNPRYYFGPIDLADFLAIGANGVDLFFVISGFCMYYFYGTKPGFSYNSFYRFIVKRWVRLSPAFYAATLIYILEKYGNGIKINGIFNFMHSVFYLNYFFGQYNTASHFWTLTVEWQFYFIIPFLLIYQNKFGFKKTFTIIFGFITFLAVIAAVALKGKSDLLTYTILFRAIEFSCGVIAARILLKNKFILNNRSFWLIAAIFITYTGRIMISKPILNISLDYHNLFKVMGFTLMGCGFAFILLLSVTSVNYLNRVLGNPLFKTMGRISYSFYLFHVLVFPIIVSLTKQYLPNVNAIMGAVCSTCISAVILIPVSLLSYTFLEKPFLSVGNLTTK